MRTETSVRLSAPARQDVFDATVWYDRQTRGLAGIFLADLKRLLDRVALFPEAAPKCRGQYRHASLAQFHYSVFYKQHASEVMVVFVRHTKRDAPVFIKPLN